MAKIQIYQSKTEQRDSITDIIRAEEENEHINHSINDHLLKIQAKHHAMVEDRMENCIRTLHRAAVLCI